jgi:hypothetical protein
VIEVRDGDMIYARDWNHLLSVVAQIYSMALDAQATAHQALVLSQQRLAPPKGEEASHELRSHPPVPQAGHTPSPRKARRKGQSKQGVHVSGKRANARAKRGVAT